MHEATFTMQTTKQPQFAIRIMFTFIPVAKSRDNLNRDVRMFLFLSE